MQKKIGTILDEKLLAVDATFGALKISPQELKSILNEDQYEIN